MMRHTARRLLNIDLPVYAWRELEVGGRVFKVDDVVPWRDLDVAPSTVMSWFRVRYVGHEKVTDKVRNMRTAKMPLDANGKRMGGPTIEEWVQAGYLPEAYPPQDFAAVESPGLTQFRKEGVGPWDNELVAQRRRFRNAPTQPMPNNLRPPGDPKLDPKTDPKSGKKK